MTWHVSEFILLSSGVRFVPYGDFPLVVFLAYNVNNLFPLVMRVRARR